MLVSMDEEISDNRNRDYGPEPAQQDRLGDDLPLDKYQERGINQISDQTYRLMSVDLPDLGGMDFGIHLTLPSGAIAAIY